MNALAWYYALRRRPAEGLPLVTRAIYHDAACADCYDTYALLSFERGDFALALRAQAIAVNLYSEQTVPELSERLRIYREAISKSASLPGASRDP